MSPEERAHLAFFGTTERDVPFDETDHFRVSVKTFVEAIRAAENEALERAALLFDGDVFWDVAGDDLMKRIRALKHPE